MTVHKKVLMLGMLSVVAINAMMTMNRGINDIVSDMYDISRGTVDFTINGVASDENVALAGYGASFLLLHRNLLESMDFRQLEQALDDKWGVVNMATEPPSTYMRLFLRDLIIGGRAQLLDIFLNLVDRAYPDLGINWLYIDAGMPYTMLDKAYKMKRAASAGRATQDAQRVIDVLIEHGGELYKNMMGSDGSQTQRDVTTPSDE